MLVLDDTQVHVWLYRHALTALPGALQLLDAQEQQRYGRFTMVQDAQAFALSHALLRRVLSSYASVPVSRWRFHSNAFGKPFIALPENYGHLQFNLSHTKTHSAIAVANADVGVDIEDTMNRRISVLSVAQRFFTPQEAQHLARLPLHEQRRQFFIYWTLKEAVTKAMGIGLGRALAQFAFDLRGPRITLAPHSDQGDSKAWQFATFYAASQHRVAIAVRCSQGTPRQLRVQAISDLSGY